MVKCNVLVWWLLVVEIFSVIIVICIDKMGILIKNEMIVCFFWILVMNYG